MAFSRSWKNVHAVSLLFTQKYVVNEMHYELFRVKGRHVESEQLPPCQDCIYMLQGSTTGCHQASPTAGRSKSTKPTGLQRLVIGWRWRTSDKLDDGSTSSEHSPGFPLLQMQEIMQAAILPVYGEWTVLYSGLYPAGLQKHEGWRCWCYARRRIRYWQLQWHPISI